MGGETNNMTNRIRPSDWDQHKIIEMLPPNDIDNSPITDFFERFTIAFWRPLKTADEIPCTFCARQSKYQNIELNMFACSPCKHEIKYQEISVCDPGDKPVSLFVRKFLCEWIDMNYWLTLSTENYLDRAEHNICCICEEVITENTNKIAVHYETYHVAHYDCAKTIGFHGCLTEDEYNSIFSDSFLEIESLLTTFSCPEISDEDEEKLKALSENFNIDLSDPSVFELLVIQHGKCWNECKKNNIPNHVGHIINRWIGILYMKYAPRFSADEMFNTHMINSDICYSCMHRIKSKHTVLISNNKLIHDFCFNERSVFLFDCDGFRKSILSSPKFALLNMLLDLIVASNKSPTHV